MHLTAIAASGNETPAPAAHDLVLAHLLASADRGDADACFELGVAFATGINGAQFDLVEAHKWFNLAAARGHEQAVGARADVADEMTAREIAEAQRRARRFLASGHRQAA
ncbi:MAG: hypothetical protein ACXIT4_03750 [Erythrobacter sp.]